MFEDHREQIDEYETDSDEKESDFKEHSELVNSLFSHDVIISQNYKLAILLAF